MKHIFAALFFISAFLAKSIAQDAYSAQIKAENLTQPDGAILKLEPFQVTASSAEMYVYFDTHGEEKTIKYIGVRNVVPGGAADRAGLKKRDRILGIGDVRVVGLSLETLVSTKISAKEEGGDFTLTYTVFRPSLKKEIDVVFRFPKKKESKGGANSERSAAP